MIIKNKSGFILPPVLIILLIMTLVVLYSMGSSILQEKTSGSLTDKEIAFQNSESGLRYVENYIYANPMPIGLFNPSCLGGYCFPSTTGVPNWETIQWGTDSLHTIQLPSGTIPKAYAQPKYIIEYLGSAPSSAGQSAKLSSNGTGGGVAYRITVYAVGERATTASLVQSIYIKQ